MKDPWEDDKYKPTKKEAEYFKKASEEAREARLEWDKNYSKKKQFLMAPLPSDVFRARMAAGLTIADAARMVYISAKQWARYERSRDADPKTRMPPYIAELFALKTGLKALEPMKREYVLGKDGMTRLWIRDEEQG